MGVIMTYYANNLLRACNTNAVTQTKNKMQNGFLFSANAFTALTNKTLAKKELSSVKYEELQIDNKIINLISKDFPNAIWQRLPLQSHAIHSPSGEFSILIRLAINNILYRHKYAAGIFFEFIKNIICVSLKEQCVENDAAIISASFPILPFSIFISENATTHIPPNIVINKKSYILLGENLLHEAIHQVVNLCLLQNNIFIEEYSATTSPKIEIGWRKNQGSARNQFWELDRTLHAVIVYIYLVKYRTAEILKLHRQHAVYETLLISIKHGMVALNYLSKALLDYEKFFTDQGVQLVLELREEVKKETLKAKLILKEINSAITGKDS